MPDERFADLTSLDTRPRGAVRARRGRSRREFLSTVGKGAVGLGLASVGFAALKMRPARSDPYDTTSGHNCSGSPNFYSVNPPGDINQQCGSSMVCNDFLYLNGCLDSQNWHRHYVARPGDAYKFRPNDCIPSTGYDAWLWDVSGGFGCGNKARFRCHDGWKIVSYQSYKTIASHKTCV